MFQHIPGCSHKKHVLIWSSKVIFSHSESLISGVSFEWNQRFLQRSRFFFFENCQQKLTIEHLWWVSHCLCWVSENFDISHFDMENLPWFTGFYVCSGSSSINMWIDQSPKTFFSRTTWILRCFFFDFLVLVVKKRRIFSEQTCFTTLCFSG